MGKKGCIKIPSALLGKIRENFRKLYPKVSNASPPLVAFAADPEYQLILGTIFFPNTGYVHVRVHFDHNIESSYKIMRVLSKHGFNVEFLSARRLYADSSDNCKMDLLVHLPAEQDKSKNDTNLKEWIWGIFHGSQLHSLGCEVSFPQVVSNMCINGEDDNE